MFRQLVTEAPRLTWLYAQSAVMGYRYRALFQNVETFALFIGCPRTGHSIIGALLDAHPAILMTHELGVLKYVHARFSRSQIYYLLYAGAQRFYAKGYISSGYQYHIPGQWQGRFETLRVIGDKGGGGTTLRFAALPWLLRRLQTTVRLPVKYIHIVRNPYDSIATHWYRATVKKNGDQTLDQTIEYFRQLYATLVAMKQQIPEPDIFELRHEHFVEDPKRHLSDLCRFLGLDAPDDYLEACASIIFKSPSRSRNRSEWSASQIAEVDAMIESAPFLRGYSYDA